MAHISRSRTLAAVPDAIWAVLSDFGGISAWASDVDHSSLLRASPEPTGLARRIQMGRITVVERIVEFDPPHALAYDIEGLPRLVRRLRNRWQIRCLSNELTTVTLTTTVTVGDRPPQRLAEQVICRVAARQSDALLTDLASLWKDTHVV